jgi:hypothetical protein
MRSDFREIVTTIGTGASCPEISELLLTFGYLERKGCPHQPHLEMDDS